MKSLTAAEYLMKELNEQRQTVIDSITTGRLSHDEYMRLCGSLQGLAFARDIIVGLAKKVEEEDDE
jgi:hypothetical protein